MKPPYPSLEIRVHRSLHAVAFASGRAAAILAVVLCSRGLQHRTYMK